MTTPVVSRETLPLNEVFGPTFQGEGPHTGRRCWFVRLGRCNLSCSWCDTPYTWDASRYDLAKENPETEAATIMGHLAEAGAHQGSMVVLSGGEPLMHHMRPALRSLLEPMHYSWHVESNGTIGPPPWWNDRVEHTTLSPKVAQDDDPEGKRIKLPALRAWADLAHDERAAFKFVVHGDLRAEAELQAIEDLAAALDLCDHHVWIMPEGTNAADVVNGMRFLAQPVQALGWNMATRLHTLLWDDERGR